MRRSASRDFIVGLFVLAGLSAVAYLSLSVGGLTLTGGGGLTVYAAFDEIGGLKPRAPVVIAGVKIGEVGPINLDKDFRARVELDVRGNLKLPTDTSASIMTSGLLGDKYIELQLGGSDQYLKPGGEITFTESAIILERLIGKLIHGSAVSNGQ
jgi:phospholipid/cholesterol/gamma-HCH transport system substrate-binding protein